MISPLRAIFRRFARPAAGTGRRRPAPRGALVRRDRWESLGLGMLGSEALEQRVLMAADLAVSLDDAHIWYAPATQTVTTIGSGRARRSAQRCLTCRHIAVDTAHRVVVLPR